MSDLDAVIIGAGPNGLAAACALARAGWSVRVLEAHPSRFGGAVGSEQATLPGFVHDVGAAFFPFAHLSPAFQALDLPGVGLRWREAAVQSAHPALDGSIGAFTTNPGETARLLGVDGARWRRVEGWFRKNQERLLSVLLSPVGALGPTARLGPVNAARFAAVALSTGAGLARRWFSTDAAQRILPALALHVDVGPDDRFGAALGFMLALTGATGGFVVPEGGAQSLADALVRRLEEHGGAVQLGARVERIKVADGRARAVITADGEEIAVRRAVLANTAAPSLYLDLLQGQSAIPGRLEKAMKRFEWGWGTFKVDWALNNAVPWVTEPSTRAAVVHTGEDLADLSRFTDQVRRGELPDDPYLVIGQQSLADPTRAPRGCHTLWAYSRVPNTMPEGWAAHAEAFCDRVEDRIEGLAPGFKQRILARRIVTPPDLQAMDANLVGGDLGGGSNAWHNQLIFRPAFPYFRYATPVKGLYLCSSYAHPGGGVHGMCGWNAAHIALRRDG
ncbi:MAG: phytoene desaturase family protein [Bradymonadia bacterium]